MSLYDRDDPQAQQYAEDHNHRSMTSDRNVMFHIVGLQHLSDTFQSRIWCKLTKLLFTPRK